MDEAMNEQQALTEGLRAHARMINRLDPDELEPLLADDFTYESQMVFSALTAKSEFMDYTRGKLDAIRRTGTKVRAEMGWLDYGFPGPCVVVSQGNQEDPAGLVLAKVRDGKLIRLEMCIVPPPSSAKRSGEYPGLNQP